jgi:hypothetical protein
LLAAASVNDGRIVVRALQTARSTGNADDNRTASLCAVRRMMSWACRLYFRSSFIAEEQQMAQNFVFVPTTAVQQDQI